MQRCPSCGGVLGRDCFNPTECVQIVQRNPDILIQRLDYENQKLRELLNRHLIDIPDFFAPEKEENVYSLDLKDDLPF